MLSPESLTRLSVLQRLLIWVLGASVTAMVGYALFYGPAQAAVTEADNELKAAEARRRGFEDELARRQALAETLARDEKQLSEDLVATPGADGTAHDLLFIVPELARRSDVQIEHWQPLPDEPVGEWGLRSPVQIQARASWPAFVAFVRRVSELPETVVLDELVLRWADGDDTRLEISLRAGALRVRPEYAHPPAQLVVRAPGPELASGPELRGPPKP